MEKILEMIDQFEEDFLTSEQVETLFCLPPGALKEWRKLKLGPNYLKFAARTIRYLKSDVADWVKEAYTS